MPNMIKCVIGLFNINIFMGIKLVVKHNMIKEREKERVKRQSLATPDQSAKRWRIILSQTSTLVLY